MIDEPTTKEMCEEIAISGIVVSSLEPRNIDDWCAKPTATEIENQLTLIEILALYKVAKSMNTVSALCTTNADKTAIITAVHDLVDGDSQ